MEGPGEAWQAWRGWPRHITAWLGMSRLWHCRLGTARSARIGALCSVQAAFGKRRQGGGMQRLSDRVMARRGPAGRAWRCWVLHGLAKRRQSRLGMAGTAPFGSGQGQCRQGSAGTALGGWDWQRTASPGRRGRAEMGKEKHGMARPSSALQARRPFGSARWIVASLGKEEHRRHGSGRLVRDGKALLGAAGPGAAGRAWRGSTEPVRERPGLARRGTAGRAKLD